MVRKWINYNIDRRKYDCCIKYLKKKFGKTYFSLESLQRLIKVSVSYSKYIYNKFYFYKTLIKDLKNFFRFIKNVVGPSTTRPLVCNLFFKITQLFVLYNTNVVSKKIKRNLDLIIKLLTLRFFLKKFFGRVSLIEVFIKLPTLAILSR